ncbi:MAG: hypothetical protein EP298_08620 [Gammaproteobacteria bacterium]|nr:MAG: hypothetical protein EP298_08620 [Gammaproteobacteria bacterium]UTW43939.1 hypothetical protein KFE69_01340 [bacterium SCSIO 12844]
MQNIGSKNLLTINQPIDVHCHGIGQYDFTELDQLNLTDIEALLSERKQQAILTLYLLPEQYENFFDVLKTFTEGKEKGYFKQIKGFALEGPLLASHGGTPHKGVWNPTKKQWQALAECGKDGLIYVIFSPDAELNPHENSNVNFPAKDTTWIAETLLSGGVLPAAGHFVKHNPYQSAQALQKIYDAVAAWGQGPTVTDHLYNDMPRNFKHAWRTTAEREQRQKDIENLNLASWNINNIEEKLGIIPATMIKNAQKGLVKIAQNFDGEHVDLAIVRKTVEITGAENMLLMTDSIESHRLAGRHLKQFQPSTLLYQNENLVAAGTQPIEQQIHNMRSIGLSDIEINQIACQSMSYVLKQRQNFFELAEVI